MSVTLIPLGTFHGTPAATLPRHQLGLVFEESAEVVDLWAHADQRRPSTDRFASYELHAHLTQMNEMSAGLAPGLQIRAVHAEAI